VFGSIALGADGPSNDIDLLVDFPQGTSPLTAIGLELALRDLLGVPVDLVPATNVTSGEVGSRFMLGRG
jgi:predicted nucleotidyltransferase